MNGDATATEAGLLDPPGNDGNEVTAKRIPGEVGIWVLVLGEMVIFAILFWIFLDAKGQNRAGFAQGQMSLDLSLGIINTLILLTSSLLVALGVERYRHDDARRACGLFLLAALLGVGFCALKAVEYEAKLSIRELFENSFYIYYFILTGLHLFHVVIGTIILLILSRFSARPRTAGRQALVESGGIFWHLVDLLWIVIFPLLYLLR